MEFEERPMRIIERILDQPSSMVNNRICEAEGCLDSTRDGKPYCPDHVEMNPHAKRVAQEIARRKKEDDQVREGELSVSEFNIHGITARSILQHLREHGTRTKERLCRELNLEREVLDGYAQALIMKGLIHPGRTNRGSVTLSLFPLAVQQSAHGSQSFPCTHSNHQGHSSSCQV
jgi:predicted transcriptional regulator